jgi:hypothetical protein
MVPPFGNGGGVGGGNGEGDGGADELIVAGTGTPLTMVVGLPVVTGPLGLRPLMRVSGNRRLIKGSPTFAVAPSALVNEFTT